MSRFILPIPGWDRYSTWGIDTVTGPYAQLQRDDTPPSQDEPDAWINDDDMRSFIDRIATTTHTQPGQVVVALAAHIGDDTEAKRRITRFVSRTTDPDILATCATARTDWLRGLAWMTGRRGPSRTGRPDRTFLDPPDTGTGTPTAADLLDKPLLDPPIEPMPDLDGTISGTELADQLMRLSYGNLRKAIDRMNDIGGHDRKTSTYMSVANMQLQFARYLRPTMGRR